ncbi:MAG: phosphoribosylglycinamide formyltransferase [Armatimonadota bacterium]
MTELLKLGVMASGGGTNLQSIIDACQSGKCPAEVVVVLSDREDAFALERARRYGIPAVHIPVGKTGSQAWEEAERQQVEALQDHGVQLVCLAGYMRINGPILLKAFERAVLNIHPALLPAFPGVHVQTKAADHGVKIAGTTVHFADPEFDTGPIIIQAAVPAFEGDDGDSLGLRILEQEHRIYPQAIKWFAEGRLQIEGRKVRVLDLNLDDPKLIYGSGGRVLINPPLDTDF